MPPVVAAVTNALLVAFSVSTGAGLVAAYYVAQGLVYIATQSILNSAIKSLTKRPKSGEARGLEVTVTDSAADGRILYGTVRVGGANVIPPLTSGTSGNYLHQVLALAIHEIDSFVSVFFYQEEILAANIGTVSGTDSDGVVSGGSYSSKAWIRNYRGTSAQTADYILGATWPSTFTSDFRGRGIAYSALRYDWGDGKVYQGAPAVTFKVKGAKVYDPRLDSTNGGSGSHRYTDSTTWAWSDNPALCWANYKMASYGFAEDGANIDWPSVITAADVCDVLVNIPGSLTEKRYRCNGVLLSTNDPRDNEKKLLDAMLGHMTFVNGKWTVHAGAWTAASYTIEKEDWLSISEIQTVAERDGGRWNRARCWFVDPDRNWQRVESFPRYNDTYKSDDGGERIELEIEQPMCTGEYQAQRVAEVVLRQSRNGQRLVGTLPPRFQRIATFETVALNFDELGWVSKTFRVVSMDINPDGSVTVALIEEQSSDWTDLDAADYGTASTAAIPTTNPTTPSAPQNFTVVPDFGVLKFDWDPPAVVPAGTRYRVISSPESAQAIEQGVVVWDGVVSDAFVGADARTHRWYHVQAYANSYFGPLQPNTYGVFGLPYFNPSDLRGNRVLPDGEFTSSVASYWDLNYASSYGSVIAVSSLGYGGRKLIRFTRTSGNPLAGLYATPVNPAPQGPSKFSIARNAFPCLPGQTLTVYATLRTNSAGADASALKLYVYGEKLMTPGSSALLATVVGTYIPAPTNPGSTTIYIGSFQLPSTYPDLNALVFQLDGTYGGGAGTEVRSGAQLDLLGFQATLY